MSPSSKLDAGPHVGGSGGVVVVGSLNLDLVLRVVRLPRVGETVVGHGMRHSHGGKGANQAVAAARLGARVAMIGRIGAEDHGPQLVDQLVGEGVDVSGVLRIPGATSGLATVTVGDDGENAIVYVPGSNMDLQASDIDAQGRLVGRARVLIGQTEVPLAALRRAFELARKASAVTLLNLAPARPIDTALMGLLDWLVVNCSEAESLSGVTIGDESAALRAAAQLRGMGAKHVVVTLGAQGAALADAAGTRLLPVAPAMSIDSTGAGDTFVGALAVALNEGAEPDEAVRFAHRAAAWSVERHGVRNGMPRRTDLPAPASAPHRRLSVTSGCPAKASQPVN